MRACERLHQFKELDDLLPVSLHKRSAYKQLISVTYSLLKIFISVFWFLPFTKCLICTELFFVMLIQNFIITYQPLNDVSIRAFNGLMESRNATQFTGIIATRS